MSTRKLYIYAGAIALTLLGYTALSPVGAAQEETVLSVDETEVSEDDYLDLSELPEASEEVVESFDGEIVEEVLEEPLEIVEETVEAPAEVVEDTVEAPAEVIEDTVEAPIEVVEEDVEFSNDDLETLNDMVRADSEVALESSGMDFANIGRRALNDSYFSRFMRVDFKSRSQILIIADMANAEHLTPAEALKRLLLMNERDYVFQNAALYKQYLLEKYSENAEVSGVELYARNKWLSKMDDAKFPSFATANPQTIPPFVFILGDPETKNDYNRIVRLYLNKSVEYRFARTAETTFFVIAANPLTRRWIVSEQRVDEPFELLESSINLISNITFEGAYDSVIKKIHLKKLRDANKDEYYKRLKIQRNRERRMRAEQRQAQKARQDRAAAKRVRELDRKNHRPVPLIIPKPGHGPRPMPGPGPHPAPGPGPHPMPGPDPRPMPGLGPHF